MNAKTPLLLIEIVSINNKIIMQLRPCVEIIKVFFFSSLIYISLRTKPTYYKQSSFS